MHRRRIERLPDRITHGGRIVIEIGVADRRHRPPELVVILGVEHGNVGVSQGDREQRHEARAVDEIQVALEDHLARQRVKSLRARHQPELRDLGLLRTASAAGLAAELLDLVIVRRPFTARQRGRWAGAKLRRRRQCERPHGWPGRTDHDRCRHVLPGPGLGTVRIGIRGAIVGAARDDLACNGFAESAAGIDRSRGCGDAGQILYERGLEVVRGLRMKQSQRRGSCAGGCRVCGSRPSSLQLRQIWLIASLD